MLVELSELQLLVWGSEIKTANLWHNQKLDASWITMRDNASACLPLIPQPSNGTNKIFFFYLRFCTGPCGCLCSIQAFTLRHYFFSSTTFKSELLSSVAAVGSMLYQAATASPSKEPTHLSKKKSLLKICLGKYG